MNYTKGKWRVKPHNFKHKNFDFVDYTVESSDNEMFSICDVYGNDENEQLANAKLISKAPEMYEALKELSKTYIDECKIFNVRLAKEIESLLKEIEL